MTTSVSSPLLLSSGSASAPGISFTSDSGTDSGLFLAASNTIGIAAAGSEVARFGSAGLSVASTATPGTVEKFRVLTPTTVDNLANVTISASAATSKPMALQAAATQTANVLEVQSSSGSTNFLVKADGSAQFDFGSSGKIGAFPFFGATFLGLLKVSTDASTSLLLSSVPSLGFGPGGAPGIDTTLTRLAAGVFNIASGGLGVNTATTFGTVQKLAVNAHTTADNTANAILSASASTSKALVVQAAASQSAQLLEAQSSAGATVWSVSAAGAQSTGTVTLQDAANIAVGTSTGSKIGTATSQKIGFYNVTPIVQPSGASQAAVATTAATNTTPYGYTTAAQADALVTLVNKIRTDLVSLGLIKGSA